MERIYTTPLLDKLGIRPGMRVAIVGTLHDDDEATDATEFQAEPRTTGRATSATARPSPTPTSSSSPPTRPPTSPRSRRLRPKIRPNGAIWVVSRKGKAATLRDVEVMAAGREHDLIDNKVVSFSATPDGTPARDPGRPSPEAAEASTIRAWDRT